MNWPLVSRRAHEDSTYKLRAERDYWKSEHERALGRAEELREQRNHLQTRVESLTNILVELRRDGFSVAKPATVRESPDDEAIGLQRAEAQLVVRKAEMEFIRNAARDIRAKTGVSETAAIAEARRLYLSVTDEDPPI